MTNRVRVTLAGVICATAQCLYQVGRLKRIRSIIAQTCDKYIYNYFVDRQLASLKFQYPVHRGVNAAGMHSRFTDNVCSSGDEVSHSPSNI